VHANQRLRQPDVAARIGGVLLEALRQQVDAVTGRDQVGRRAQARQTAELLAAAASDVADGGGDGTVVGHRQ
jgi:hypothetical protein